jgi:CubicO group peptidase (beta-lactamase class C family)
MPARARSLPSRPSLRYLKLEAKRRLAGGEFPTLHEAQAAIAREHGLPSWAALKQLISGRPISDQPQQEGHALAQLRWIVARFRDADQPGWAAPDESEMRQHFADRLLDLVPVGELIKATAQMAAELRADLVVVSQELLQAQVRLVRMEYFASVEADPPHRIAMLRGAPISGPITDARVAAAPPARTLGEVPAAMARLADEVFTELGLVGLVLAGGGPDSPVWSVAKGWANVDRAESLDTSHRFPAYCAAALVTATAVLRLVAEGRFALDTPANERLRTVRLADDTITVRELLSYTAGVDNPTGLFADSVCDLVTLTGPVIGCSGTRGAIRLSNGGYAVLGQLIADVTGRPYADAVTELVLRPLGMNGLSFPARSADIGPDTVTGYDVTRDGNLVPVPAKVATIQAIGGLWASAPDVVRLGAGWSSLLPGPLAREALTPQTPPLPGGIRAGLGWLILPLGDAAVQLGAAPGTTAYLLIRPSDRQVYAALTTTMTAMDRIEERLLRSWSAPDNTAG